MKMFKALAIAAAMLASPLSAPAALAQSGPGAGIEYEVIFLDDTYSEVGRWIFYCRGGSDLVGEFGVRQYTNYYGCPA